MGEPLVLRFSDRHELEREHAQNLAHGRAFVPGATGHALFSTCRLLIEHPCSDTVFAVDCEVVMVMDQGAMQGIAVQFRDRSEETATSLAAFVASLDVVSNAADNTNDETSHFADDTNDDADEVGSDVADDLDDELEADADAERDSRDPAWSLARERQQRLRHLSIPERLKIARGPNLEERVLLERIYGANVWEPLLRNPKITVPEVARMAKKGTMPRPLLELIVDNEQWIRQSIVRRALLSNPRLSPEGAAKVLRTLSARELKLVPQQTAYPATVRAIATRMLRSG